MRSNIILDTSVLVALLSRQDDRHTWAKTTAEAIAKPLLTCEAVLTEACFLLRNYDMGRGEVLRAVRQGYMQIPFRVVDEIDFLMQRYQNVPISLADACLVRMSEIYQNSAILTTVPRNGKRVTTDPVTNEWQ